MLIVDTCAIPLSATAGYGNSRGFPLSDPDCTAIIERELLCILCTHYQSTVSPVFVFFRVVCFVSEWEWDSIVQLTADSSLSLAPCSLYIFVTILFINCIYNIVLICFTLLAHAWQLYSGEVNRKSSQTELFSAQLKYFFKLLTVKLPLSIQQWWTKVN